MRFPDALRLAVTVLLLGVQAVPADEIDRMRAAGLSGSERLRLRAYGMALETGNMPRPALARMRRDMIWQGYYFDGGPLSLVAADAQAAPMLAWDGNINGGVLQDRFVLNGLVFESDPAFRAKAGIVAGAAAGGLLRFAWGVGRLIELQAAAEAGWSPRHGIGRGDLMLSVCSRNHVSGWNFLDFCALGRRYWRELGNGASHQLSAEFSRIFPARDSVHEVAVKYVWEPTDDAYPNQLSVSLASIWDRAATEISVTVDDPVAGATYAYNRVDASVGWLALDRGWSLDVWMQRAEGGMFLGVPRKDRARGIGIATDLRPGTSLRLGYLDSRSTAGIANYDQVTLDVRFDYFRW